MAYADLSAELTGVLPGLSGLLADNYIQRALRGIYADRNWSFQLAEAGFVCPVQITAGSASFVQFANTVTMSAAAATALTPYVAGNPLLTQMQIRFAAGQVYNITGVAVGPMVLTLDRIIIEATAATSSYQVYRCFVTAPVADFIRWDSVIDIANGLPLKTDLTSAYFDGKDPQRTAFGQAFMLGHYKPDVAVAPNLIGLPRYELWPVPVQGQSFYARYKRRGPGFVLAADVQPDVIPDTLILDRALYKYAYPWAQANANNFPTFKNINFALLAKNAKGSYDETMVNVRRLDDEIRCQSIRNRGHGLRGPVDVPYPIDANFLQSHLVNI